MGDARKRIPARHTVAVLAAGAVLALCAPAGAAEGPDQPAEPLLFRIGLSTLSGFPDLLGIQLGLWMPNRFLVEAGASGFTFFRSAHVRVGFPLAFPAGSGRVAISPAVGVRWEQGEREPFIGCFGDEEECTETSSEWNLLGVNAVLGLDWVRMVTAHWGASFQVVGGATVRVVGYDDTVETTYGDEGDIVVREDNYRARPDLRFAFGFVF